jgi:hypothetical protein
MESAEGHAFASVPSAATTLPRLRPAKYAAGTSTGLFGTTDTRSPCGRMAWHRCAGVIVRCIDQAVRVRRVLPRSGRRRVLHPHRPELSVAVSSLARLPVEVRRVGPTREQSHAGVRRGAGAGAAEPWGAGQGRAIRISIVSMSTASKLISRRIRPGPATTSSMFVQLARTWELSAAMPPVQWRCRNVLGETVRLSS